jgi:hypothetical protein
VTATTGAEIVAADNTAEPIYSFAFQDTFQTGTGNELNGSGYNYVMWQMRRAPSFFDQVCYTGDGSTTTRSHNLGVAPELVIIKCRTTGGDILDWRTTFTPYTAAFKLNTAEMYGVNGPSLSSASASSFTLASATNLNTSGQTYVAYLFASCPGVSKVGSYTGTATTQTINCGFTGGARFVLIKRTDSTGDWYVWDTARGMVSGTDPSTLLNVEEAEVNANSVYTIATGFQIVSTASGINASGGTYIFLAIA